MKKAVLILGGLLLVATFVYAFAGDVGVGTKISINAISLCGPGQGGYRAWFNITNYNVTNATATNVTYVANITDDGINVYAISNHRYLTVGETYAWSVYKCTTGNETNHTIQTTIYTQSPEDSNPLNNFDMASKIVYGR